MPLASVEYWHVELDDHDIIFGAETCVPPVFEGPILHQLRARLLARAQTLGYRITSDWS